MAKKQVKKAASKKAAKKIIKTNDLPQVNFGQAIRAIIKAKKQ